MSYFTKDTFCTIKLFYYISQKNIFVKIADTKFIFDFCPWDKTLCGGPRKYTSLASRSTTFRKTYGFSYIKIFGKKSINKENHAENNIKYLYLL